jgi:tetratricopeptide (TPR) repeat protein
MGFTSGCAALLTLFLATRANSATEALDLDSLRHQVAALSAAGEFDSAAALVTVAGPGLPPSWENLMYGKLELQGGPARKAFETVAKDSLHGQIPHGEALFRLGQLHYASGHYGLAIPQFREYLTRYPKGPWRDPAAYWMAYACLQLAQLPSHKQYLDSGLRYLTRLQTGRPRGYYFPLALTAKARLLLARGKEGDTTSALAALEEARRRMPPEEFASTLLLSAQAAPLSNPDDKRLWEDSVLWEFPSSLEASFLVARFPVHKASSAHVQPSSKNSVLSATPKYALLLGNFSVSKNADEMRKTLAAKGIRVWVEQKSSHESRMFSVLHGIFSDSGAARKEGNRLFKPLSFPFQIIPLQP